MADEYDFGGSLDLNIEVQDIDGGFSDPSTLLVKYRNPNQTLVTLVLGTDVEIVQDSVGHYHVTITKDIAGYWTWAAQADDLPEKEKTFRVKRSAFD
jgi:hypothetical protein